MKSTLVYLVPVTFPVLQDATCGELHVCVVMHLSPSKETALLVYLTPNLLSGTMHAMLTYVSGHE